MDKRIFTGRYVLPSLRRGHYSLLFTRLNFSFEALIEALPELDVDKPTLQEILKRGKQKIRGESLVYAFLDTITKFYRPEIKELLTPVINVIEYTQTELLRLQNYDPLNEDNLLKEDHSQVLDGNTGEMIYQFTKFNFKEEDHEDRIVEYKINEYDYDRLKSGKSYMTWEW